MRKKRPRPKARRSRRKILRRTRRHQRSHTRDCLKNTRVKSTPNCSRIPTSAYQMMAPKTIVSWMLWYKHLLFWSVLISRSSTWEHWRMTPSSMLLRNLFLRWNRSSINRRMLLYMKRWKISISLQMNDLKILILRIKACNSEKNYSKDFIDKANLSLVALMMLTIALRSCSRNSTRTIQLYLHKIPTSSYPNGRRNRWSQRFVIA